MIDEAPKPREVGRHVVGLHIRGITHLVAGRTKLTPEQIMTARKNTSNALEARHCVMWLAYHGLGFGWSQIKHATRRDHTTVINGVRRFGRIMTENEYWRRTAHELLEEIGREEHLTAIKTLPVVVCPPPKPVVAVPRKMALPVRRPIIPEDPGPRAEIPMYNRDGDKGTSRAFLEAQNERFAAAMRKALKG